MLEKTSIRYFNNIPVRARWDNENKEWLYAATDIIKAITESDNSRRYWNTFKSRHPEVSSICGQLKMIASDGKAYNTDVLNSEGVQLVLLSIKGCNKIEVAKWIKGLASPIDEESRSRAYELFSNGLINSVEVGTTKGLQQIHSYLFSGLYTFAGKIRNKNISKGGFVFANSMMLIDTLKHIDEMPQSNIEEIIDKYIEMNIAHPFMEGNGRATRIWLDMLLRQELNIMVDWSKIDKNKYLEAMEKSPINSKPIYTLITNALTKDINSHEIFMKGIDYSYYYEEIE